MWGKTETETQRGEGKKGVQRLVHVLFLVVDQLTHSEQTHDELTLCCGCHSLLGETVESSVACHLRNIPSWHA
jgi:hypothetical protein